MTTETALDPARLRVRHKQWGWWLLFVSLLLGMALDILHGLKLGWYLDVSSQTRRLMWTLAHAHGTLVALVHLAFASAAGELAPRARGLASKSLIAAGVLLPGGFLLGGVYTYSGDPGVGALAAPIGGVLLIVAVGLTARAMAQPEAPKIPAEATEPRSP